MDADDDELQPTGVTPSSARPPRPARRRRLDPVDRRRLLLLAAAAVFARRGYEAAHMAEVATEAGVAKGLLYRHFPTKEALYAAVLDEQAAAFEARVEERMLAAAPEAAARGLLDPVTFGIAAWLDQALDDLSAGRLPDPGTHDQLQVFRDRLRAVATRHLRLVRPDLQPDLARLVAAAVLGATEAAGRAWLAEPGSLDADGLRRTIEALLLPGLGALGDGPPR